MAQIPEGSVSTDPAAEITPPAGNQHLATALGMATALVQSPPQSNYVDDGNSASQKKHCEYMAMRVTSKASTNFVLTLILAQLRSSLRNARRRDLT